MIGLSNAHTSFRSFLMTLERSAGKRFFPQAGQIMYAPSLEQELIKNPQGAVNKIGFFIQGDGPYEFGTYKLALQCLLTYPECVNDTEYITSLSHSDDLLSAINDKDIPGVGILTRSDGPIPIPNIGFLGVRIDFSITTIS